MINLAWPSCSLLSNGNLSTMSPYHIIVSWRRTTDIYLPGYIYQLGNTDKQLAVLIRDLYALYVALLRSFLYAICTQKIDVII